MKNRIKELQLRHIVQICAYYPPHIGGVELRVQELAERLAKEEYKISVLTSRIGSKEKKVNSKNLSVNYLPAIEIAHTPIMPTLPWRILRLKRDRTILHIHIAQAIFPESVALVAKLRRIPYIAHFRMDADRSGRMGFLLPLHKKWVLGPVLRRAKLVIVNSPDYVTLTEEKYKVDKRKIVVIPNASYFSLFKEPRDLLSDTPRVLFVGRFVEQKNPLLLLQAINLLKKSSVPFELIMVGDGEMRPEIERYIKNNDLQSYVKLLGFLSGSELEKQYELADIFVLSSRAESFGTVLIEAMTKGLPIVATDITAVRNTVINGKNGLLVPQDSLSIADAIQKLIADSELYKTISANNIQNSKDYRWEDIIKKVELVYES